MINFFKTICFAFNLLCLGFFLPAKAQLGISFQIPKPKEYEDRVMRSERSDEKKFTLPKRFIQNMVTHYNYAFNAKNKLNEVINHAKENYKEDYASLLSFYNFSLDDTRRDSIQLDSITYKASAGIGFHDLRNDWVDNLYLFWGISYYLQKKFDSAYLMFQFINYAFAPKEKDGYYRTIGSSRDGNSAFSISTPEKTNLPKKIFTVPPSRNDAFIWQIRNHIVLNELTEAASLIEMLKKDPVFPKRLLSDLNELQALWFYKNEIWDSSANHLVLALDNASNSQEKARWEFLAGQLFEKAKNYTEALKYYAKVPSHSTDVILEIYARLAMIRVNKTGNENDIQKNISELLKMAKKDKYDDFRDVIYYMAAQMELERNNVPGAEILLQKSVRVPVTNYNLRNKAYLSLSTYAYQQKHFIEASNFLDSVKTVENEHLNTDSFYFQKQLLKKIAAQISVIERQDSLQRISKLSENERKLFVKNLVKKLRKDRGLTDDNSSITFGSSTSQTGSLFSNSNNKGEWYFYNNDAKQKGNVEFKTRWGNRPNVDNWRRSAVVGLVNITPNNTNNLPLPSLNNGKLNDGDITFENLYNGLLLTDESLKKSNDSINLALYQSGLLFIQQKEDCENGTLQLEKLRVKSNKYDSMASALFNLYYCYFKNGNFLKAAEIKGDLLKNYENSAFANTLATGKKNDSSSIKTAATQFYENVYNLFLSGKYEAAADLKIKADSIYGKNYWTPQLLYIEAVYYVKQQKDSLAKNILIHLNTQFPNSAITKKGNALLSVLSRRKQIEDELNNYQISTHSFDSNIISISKIDNKYKDTLSKVKNNLQPKNKLDTGHNVPKINTTVYSYFPEKSHYVVLFLNKVDKVFCNESKNAFDRYNHQTYYNKSFNSSLLDLNTDIKLLIINPFSNAEDALFYINSIKSKTTTEIIPWLNKGNYKFGIISDDNLNLLLSTKDFEAYSKFLSQKYEGKF